MKHKRENSHSIYIVSLGCSKNLLDTEQVMACFKRSGMVLTVDFEQADAVAINTCGFIESAQVESLSTIAEFCELKAEGTINALVVWGCLVNRHGDDLPTDEPPFDQVDAWLPIEDAGRVSEIIEGLLTTPATGEVSSVLESPLICGRVLATPVHTAYLRLAEGCDNRCAYCTIPQIRGRFHSRPVEEIVDEAKALADAGVLELNLVAQDTTRYGSDLYGEPSLGLLLKQLDQIEGLRWIRILYAHPARVDDRLIEAIAAADKVCHYLDIPIQHASDKILSAMKRGLSRNDLETLLDNIKRQIPDIVLRTTVMIGFPGETKKDFKALLQFLNDQPFDYVGTFPFSRETGTPAFDMDNQIAERVIEKRMEILNSQIDYVCEERRSRFLGETADVLVDGPCPDSGWYQGRWNGQAPDIDGHVYFQSPHSNPVGTIVPVTLTHLIGADFTGAQR